MKLLSNYKFKNDKDIRLWLLTEKEIKKHKFNSVDFFCLEFVIGEESHKFGLRPDEVTMISSILSRGLWRGVHGYKIKAMKKGEYDGFDTNS